MDQQQPLVLMVMDSMVNIQQLCRLCGSKTEEFNRLNLFDAANASLNLPLTIKSCLGLEISELDNLPKVVCVPCLSNLDNFSKFKSTCESTTRLLSSLCHQHVAYNHPQNAGNVTYRSPAVVTSTIVDNDSTAVVDNSFVQPVSRAEIDHNQWTNCTPVRDHFTLPNSSHYNQTNSMNNSSYVIPEECNNQSGYVEMSNREVNAENSEEHKYNVCPDMTNNTGKFTSVQRRVRKSVQKPQKKVKPMDKVPMTQEPAKGYKALKKRRFKNNGPIPKIKKIYNCDFCSKSFTWRNCITEHIVGRHLPPGKRIICKLCNKDFKNKICFKLHIRSQHEKEYKYICDICGWGVMERCRFENHVREKHTNERPFECSQCDKKFASKYKLNNHMSLVHCDKSIQWNCDICNRSFANSRYLRSHRKKHDLPIEEQKKSQCSVCGARFRRPSDLKVHLRTHSGEKPHECKICRKSFARPEGLAQHMLIHTGVRNHVCEICGSAFALQGNLKIHRLSVHEGIKKFRCNDCDKSYTQNKNLNIHIRKTGHTRFKNK